MRHSRQIQYVRQLDFIFIRTYLPEQAGYVHRREDSWKSTRTSDVPEWNNDYDGSLPEPRKEKQQSPAKPQQRIVLHIDDDEEDRELFQEALLKLDATIKVQQAGSGKAALSFLKQSKEIGNLPCLIILDINMPGMNGKEVLKEIKKDQELASLPLILFTTSPESTYREFVKKENVQFITKPLTPSELINTAKGMLKHCTAK
ncbi:MAG: response regulator [Flavisolibacter sp.]